MHTFGPGKKRILLNRFRNCYQRARLDAKRCGLLEKKKHAWLVEFKVHHNKDNFGLREKGGQFVPTHRQANSSLYNKSYSFVYVNYSSPCKLEMLLKLDFYMELKQLNKYLKE